MATRIDVSVGEAQLRQKAREQTEANRMVKLEALERSKEEARLRDKLAEVRGFLGVGIDGKPLYGRLMPNRYKPDEPAAFLTRPIEVGVFGNYEIDSERNGTTLSWVLRYYPYENGTVSTTPALTETLASFPDVSSSAGVEYYDATANYDYLSVLYPGGIGGSQVSDYLMPDSDVEKYPIGRTARYYRNRVSSQFDHGIVLLPVRRDAFIWLVYGFASQATVNFDARERIVNDVVPTGYTIVSSGIEYSQQVVTQRHTILQDERSNSFDKVNIARAFLVSDSAIRPISFPEIAWQRLKASVDEPLPPLFSYGTRQFETVVGFTSPPLAYVYQMQPAYTFSSTLTPQRTQASYSVFSFSDTYGYGYVGSSPSQEVWTAGVYSFMKDLPIPTPSPISRGATNVAVQNSSGFKWGAVRPFPVPAGTTVQAKGKGKTYAYGPYAWTWDWGRSGYCRQQLLELGFTPEDLTP